MPVRARRSQSSVKPVMEPLHSRLLLSAATDDIGLTDGLTPPITVLSLPTIPRLTTTYHGIVTNSLSQSATAAMHIDSFTHTAHFTATLTVYVPNATVTGSVTGVIKPNLHVIFTYNLSGSGHTASGTGSGKVNTTGKTIRATLTGIEDGKAFAGTMALTRK